MTHAELLAACVRMASDFTIGEEDDARALGEDGRPRTVRTVIACCTFNGRRVERTETAGPGAEERVLTICHRSLSARSTP